MKDAYWALFRYRDLIKFMIDREQTGALYKTIGGKSWLVLEPLTQMMMYYFLVVIIFHGASAGGASALVTIMTGLTHYLFFQKSVLGSCRAILKHEGLLLQVAIEPLVLNAVSFGRHLYNFSITLTVFGVVYWWLGPAEKPNIAWYPACLIVLLVVTWTWAMILSILTVFFRDLQNLSAVMLRLLMYLSPVIYGLNLVPEFHFGVPLRNLYLLNPVAAMFSLLQWCLIGGEEPPRLALVVVAVFVAVSVVMAHALYWLLRPKITKAF